MDRPVLWPGQVESLTGQAPAGPATPAATEPVPVAGTEVRRRSFVGPRLVTWLLVAVGVGLRVRQYLFDRSIWNDEAELALTVMHHGYYALTRPQKAAVSPVGFLWAERFVYLELGPSERAFRFVPFLFAVVGVVAFRYLALRVLRAWPAVVALGLFALSPALVYFADEAKTYGVDATVVVLLGLLYVHLRDAPGTSATRVTWGVAGALAAWVSYPALIVTVIGFVLLGGRSVLRRQWLALAILVLGALVWCASFVIEDVVTLRPLHAYRSLEAFWASGYPPVHGSVLPWLWTDVKSLVSFPFDLDFGVLAVAVVAAGLLALLVRRRPMGALAVLVFAGAIGAALLREYPLESRLAVYLDPLAFLAMGELLDVPPRLIGAAGVGAVSISLVSQAAAAAVHPYTRNEGREALEYALDHRGPDSAVVVQATGTNVMAYYMDVDGLKATAQVFLTAASRTCVPSAQTRWLDSYRSVWVLFFGSDGANGPTWGRGAAAQPEVPAYERALRSVGPTIRRYDFPGAVDILIDVEPKQVGSAPPAGRSESCPVFVAYPHSQQLAP